MVYELLSLFRDTYVHCPHFRNFSLKLAGYGDNLGIMDSQDRFLEPMNEEQTRIFEDDACYFIKEPETMFVNIKVKKDLYFI